MSLAITTGRRMRRPILGCTLAATALLLACSSEPKEDGDEDEGASHVELSALTAPARASVEKLVAGGKVDKIDKETEKGVKVYDVEATVGGKHVEYTISEADGSVLGTETEIAVTELPAAVSAAAKEFFGKATDLAASKGDEGGKTYYEITGTKGGKKVEVTFDPAGKKIE